MFLELLAEYGLFFAKIATFVVAILIVIAAIFNASQRGRQTEQGELKIKKINDRFKAMEHALRDSVMDPHEYKSLLDEEKKSLKTEEKAAKKKHKSRKNNQEKQAEKQQKRVYVLDFDGDIKASAVDKMREEITAVLTLCSKEDEIVLKLESPGGMVHAYGLAASQLERIKQAEIPLTICVDKVAASGGYMMACIADKILAAPFAIIGSIGVVASLPNFNRVLKKYDVDYEVLTAGEYKRTLTMLGENTQEGRDKFLKDLEDTHHLFQDFVGEYRPQLAIKEVSTGETWYGKKALENKLVDGVSTSDSYISSLAKEADIYEVKFEIKKQWQEKIGVAAENAMERSIDKVLGRVVRDWESRF